MRPSRLTLVLLVTIVAVYVVIGVLYARFTPIWQVPDEPAHFNYVRALAEGRDFPVMEPGDYDQEYLALLTSQGFPPELSVGAVAYEDHQPPLYYLLATPVYWLFGDAADPLGAVLPLRLLSVLLGTALLVVVFGTVRAIFPARPAVALSATAFVAFIPQHVAMTAGVNNDTLAELVVGGTLWALVVYLRGGMRRPWPAGLLVAAALLTKGSIYIVVPLAVVAVVIRWRQERQTWGWAVGQLAWMLVPALWTTWRWRAGRAIGNARIRSPFRASGDSSAGWRWYCRPASIAGLPCSRFSWSRVSCGGCSTAISPGWLGISAPAWSCCLFPAS